MRRAVSEADSLEVVAGLCKRDAIGFLSGEEQLCLLEHWRRRKRDALYVLIQDSVRWARDAPGDHAPLARHDAMCIASRIRECSAHNAAQFEQYQDPFEVELTGPIEDLPQFPLFLNDWTSGVSPAVALAALGMVEITEELCAHVSECGKAASALLVLNGVLSGSVYGRQFFERLRTRTCSCEVGALRATRDIADSVFADNECVRRVVEEVCGTIARRPRVILPEMKAALVALLPLERIDQALDAHWECGDRREFSTDSLSGILIAFGAAPGKRGHDMLRRLMYNRSCSRDWEAYASSTAALGFLCRGLLQSKVPLRELHDEAVSAVSAVESFVSHVTRGRCGEGKEEGDLGALVEAASEWVYRYNAVCTRFLEMRFEMVDELDWLTDPRELLCHVPGWIAVGSGTLNGLHRDAQRASRLLRRVWLGGEEGDSECQSMWMHMESMLETLLIRTRTYHLLEKSERTLAHC